MKILKLLIILIPSWFKLHQIKNEEFEPRYQKLKVLSSNMLKFAGYKLNVYGKDNIKDLKGVVYISNHQGTMDPVPIVAASDCPISFISKVENEKLPIFGLAAKLLNNIHFDRESREGNIYMLRESMRRLKKGNSILIFPEGTRSKSTKMNEFKEGAFQVAISSKVKIVPVTINGLYKLSNTDIDIHFHEPINYEDYKDMEANDISNMVYKIIESKL